MHLVVGVSLLAARVRADLLTNSSYSFASFSGVQVGSVKAPYNEAISCDFRFRTCTYESHPWCLAPTATLSNCSSLCRTGACLTDSVGVDFPTLGAVGFVCPRGTFFVRVWYEQQPENRRGETFFSAENYCVACASGTYQPTATEFGGGGRVIGPYYAPPPGGQGGAVQLSSCAACPTNYFRTEPRTGASRFADCVGDYAEVYPGTVVGGVDSNPVTCDFADETYAYPRRGQVRTTCSAAAASCFFEDLNGPCPGPRVDVPVTQLARGETCPPGRFGVRVRYAFQARDTFTGAATEDLVDRDYCIACSAGTWRPDVTDFRGAAMPRTLYSYFGVTQFSTCSICPGLKDFNYDVTVPQTGAASVCDCAQNMTGKPSRFFPPGTKTQGALAFYCPGTAAQAARADPLLLRISTGKGAAGAAAAAACAWTAALGAAAAAAALLRW